MQTTILIIHSIIRYFILLFAVVVVIQSLVGMLGKKPLTGTNKRMALFLLISCDIQLLLGLFLYFAGPWFHVLTTGGSEMMKDPATRFWTVEHAFVMIVAIILVHIGYSVIKKNIDDARKYKRLFWCSFIALVLFFATIPWEGRPVIGRPNIPSMTH